MHVQIKVQYCVKEAVLFEVTGGANLYYPRVGEKVDLPGHLLKCVDVIHKPLQGVIKVELDQFPPVADEFGSWRPSR